MTPPLSYIKRALAALGARLSRRRVEALCGLTNYLALGRWMADHGFHFPVRYPTWHPMFDAVADRLAHRRVLYLEFGVYRGDYIRRWAARLKHPEARLHGFDSFEGLPEAWGPFARGHYSTSGQLPNIADPRVTFFKGWFNDTLPTYVPPPHERLVVMLDADLYASTAVVLHHLRPHITPGTLLYFDELHFVEHEARAFHEFMEHTGLRFRGVCADVTLSRAFFEAL